MRILIERHANRARKLPMTCDDDFFDRWFPGELNHHTGFHQIMLATLPRTGKILDLGCGGNDSLTNYRSAEREVWGTDYVAHPLLKHADSFRLLSTHGTIP